MASSKILTALICFAATLSCASAFGYAPGLSCPRLRSISSRNGPTLKIFMNDEPTIDTKAVASTLGGILGNLKSGKGLFGAEATKSFSKTVLNTVEQQIAEVGDEIRASEPASSIKKSDMAVSAKVISKPTYSDADRWDVTVTCSTQGTPLEVTVRPTQQAMLLIKVWAKENGQNAEEWDLVVPKGASWTYGIVDPSSSIGDSGILDGGKVSIVRKE